MDKIEFQSLIRGEIEQAVNYHDSEFAAEDSRQIEAYYRNVNKESQERLHREGGFTSRSRKSSRKGPS